MNEGHAIDAIIRDRWLRHFCLQNYTPLHWFECDVFELTRAGYFKEYEVKLTVADFRADADKFKNMDKWVNGSYELRPKLVKQEAIAARSTFGPVEFYYVAPAGLINEMLPEWAGLIELFVEPKWPRVRAMMHRRAPRLHNAKLDPKIEAHARGVCYYRMHRLRSAARASNREAFDLVEAQ